MDVSETFHPETSGSCLKQGILWDSAGLEGLTPQAGSQALFTVQQVSLDLGYIAGAEIATCYPPSSGRERSILGPEVRWRGGERVPSLSHDPFKHTELQHRFPQGKG